jgi:hypothetical protein
MIPRGQRRSRSLWPLAVLVGIGSVVPHPHPLPTPSPAAGEHRAVEGFGATTRAGNGEAPYHVTRLADTGPGTLREALSRGRRRIVFDVGGTIALESVLRVRGPFITLDASSAPSPGVTLTNHGLAIRGSDGAHDVLVRGLRVRGPVTRQASAKSSHDCVSISHGAYNVVIDHVSISGCRDGAIDITGDSRHLDGLPTRNVTVQWSILADTRKTMLVKYGTARITLHHNLFVRGLVRLPHVSRERQPADPDLTVDMRNNVVWDWAGGFGTSIVAGATANIVNNVYGNPGGALRDRQQAVVVCRGTTTEHPEICGTGPAVGAHAYVEGNVSLDAVDLDRAGTVAVPFAAADVATTAACPAARRVLADAGAGPRDAVDAGYVAMVALGTCA